MISDVLHDAARDVRAYLDDPAFRGVYTGETRARIEAALVAMDAARELLDTPPRAKDEDRACDARHPRGYECTLPARHHGRHEAHGTEGRAILTWERS